MLQVANLKIICTFSTEAFSKLRSAGLNHHLPKLSIFSLTFTARTQVEQKGLIDDLGRKEAYFNCVFVTFPCGIQGQVWYMIVSIADLCHKSKHWKWTSRSGPRISGKGVHTYKGVGVHFADFISFFLNIP